MTARESVDPRGRQAAPPSAGDLRAAAGSAARTRLALVLLAGLLVQVLVRSQDWSSNPFSRIPQSDAAHNWEWAGRIAAGDWIDEAPFFGAPLVPYLVALVRALGGGLLAWSVVQVALLLGAAGLVARAAGRLVPASPSAPALAAALLLFTTDAAHTPGRVLSGSTQLLLAAWVLERATALASAPTARGALQLGLAAGLATLAWPVMLPLILALGLWAGLRCGARSGSLLVAAAALAIAPATLHNRLAGGVWIPVTAHAGVTFFHGNNPGADGTISGSGLSMDKAVHRQEALAETRRALGSDAGWDAVSGHFLGQGLAWWRAEPGRAMGLALRKAALFLGGRHYGDIDLVTLERDAVLPTLWLAPLPGAWLAAAGLAAALLALRRRAPELLPAALLAVAALGVVTVFWYTPRYRLPALPASALLAAWGLAQADGRRWLLAGLGVGLAASTLVSIRGWDDPARFEPRFHLALARSWEELGRVGPAREEARRAHELGEPGAAVLLAELEGGALGLEALEALAAQRPGDGELQRRLAVALAGQGRVDEAVARFRAAAEVDALDWRARQGLAAALFQAGRPSEAVAPAEEALALAPGEVDVVYTRGILAEALGEEGAVALAERALALEPEHGPSRDLLVRGLRGRGEDGRLVEVLEEWLQEEPQRWPMRALAAWLLSTSSRPGVRSGARALALLQGWLPEPPDADALDTLAAAQAAAGRFPEAVTTARRALEAAGNWSVEQQAQLLQRLEAYERDEAWTEAD
jgi:Flp pilus assembly protein TadD